MKTRKRILSFLLAVCLTLTAAIPAVFALEGEGGVLTYTFGVNSSVLTGKTNSSGNVVNANANPYNGESNDSAYALINGDGYLLNNSGQDRGFKILTNSVLARYNTTSNANGAWFAIKIGGISEATYEMTFHFNSGASNGGLAKVYVVKSDVYDTALATYVAGLKSSTILTQQQNTDFINALYTNNGVLNAGKEVVLDCYKCDALVHDQSIGNVSFPADADKEFVLIFQCAGDSTNSSTDLYQFQVESLTMTPVEESIQVSTGDALKSALSAAESDSTIVLSNSITVEEALEIPAGVTLNLNGYNLTASSVNASAAGAQVIDSSDGDSILTVAKNDLSGNGDNGGYMPLYDSTGYRFYKVATNSIDADTSVANAAKLRFQVKFNNADAYALILKGTTGVSIKGTFDGSVKSTGTFTYADETDFAAAWATAANANEGKVAIVVNLSGLDAVDTLTLTPSVYNAGVSIFGTALTAKG